MTDIGRGVLAISCNVDPAHDAGFNAWYQRQHVAERLGVPGFIEARPSRRLGAHSAAEEELPDTRIGEDLARLARHARAAELEHDAEVRDLERALGVLL